MSESSPTSGRSIGAFPERRIGRLRREIALLEVMNDTLWKKSLKCAALVVGGLFCIFLICAAKLNWFGFKPLEALSLSAMVAFGCWWFGRYSKILGLTLGFLALSIISESFWVDGITGDSVKDALKPSKTERRRLKAITALKKRRALLVIMEAK
jgi:hypothetical protein